MDSYPPIADALAAGADLRARDIPFVMATVVRAVAPTSAKPGDKLVFTHAGVVTGWVGGSCAEPIVRREAEAALRDGECRLLHITPNAEAPAGRDGLSVHKMECYSGGALEIYLEPYLPMPELLVFGNSPVARALCDLGRVMKYRVTVVDLGDRPSMGGELDVVRDLGQLRPVTPSSTFAVVSSHGVFDEESLEKAIALDIPYIGFVTSAKRRAQVFASLQAKGIAAERLARIQAPAGLELGAVQPQEIALAVMAEIVAVRRLARGDALKPATVPAVIPAAPIDVTAHAAPAAKSCCHGKSDA